MNIRDDDPKQYEVFQDNDNSVVNVCICSDALYLYLLTYV